MVLRRGIESGTLNERSFPPHRQEKQRKYPKGSKRSKYLERDEVPGTKDDAERR